MTRRLYYVDVRRWRDAVRDAVELDIATRGMLFVLTRWMNTNGKDCFPGRARIAAYCGSSERQVDRYLTAAHKAGYLYLVTPGHRGQHAVYAATVPADRLDKGGKVIPRKVKIARHQRRANGEKARHDDADSATSAARKRDTHGAPTYVSTPTEVLPPSDSFESGPRIADAMSAGATDEQLEDEERQDDEEQDVDADLDWLDHLLGLDGAEMSTATGMLEKGSHRRAVENTIVASRERPPW